MLIAGLWGQHSVSWWSGHRPLVFLCSSPLQEVALASPHSYLHANNTRHSLLVQFSSQWAELQTVHLAVDFAWENEKSRCVPMYRSWVMVSGLMNSQRFRMNMIRKLLTKKSGERRYVKRSLSKQAEDVRYLFPVWMLAKEWFQQRRSLKIK
jgi:hypothetical protein